MLPKQAVYYFTQVNNKRAINYKTLEKLAIQHGLSGNSYPSVREAYNKALNAAGEDDFIFVGGSSYVVGDFLKTCI